MATIEAMSKQMNPERKMTRLRKMAPIWRTIIEVGFIIFLFYSNLLMGQFVASGPGEAKGLFWSIVSIVTPANFTIALITAFIGHVVIEFLRKRV